VKVRSASAVLGVAAMLTSGMAGAAQAAAPVQPVASYSGTDSFDVTDCGQTLHFEVTFSGKDSIRPAPRSDEAFLLHDRYRFSERISLAANPDGPYVITEVKGNFIETRARLLDPAEPTIYQFWTVDAGTFRLYSSTGELLVRSNGVFKGSNIQDTGGDKAPGSTFIREVSGDFRGNESGDFCEAIRAELT
jgi:hypothetical protein